MNHETLNSTRFEKLLEQLMFGELDIHDYRRQREELINNILKSSEAITETDFNSITQKIKRQTNAQNNKSSLQIPTIQKQSESSTTPTWKIIGILVLISVAIISWYFSDQNNADTTQLESQNGNPLQTIKNSDKQASLMDEPFILAFNNINNWDTETISNFLVQWQSLSRTQQSMARKTESFIELSKILKEKISYERKLNAEKKQPASRKENLLIWFASQLSIGLK